MDIYVAPKMKKYRKIGLAFGGGASRGFALIGVIRAFEEANIKFDYICGTSIGSLMGALLAYGLNSYQMEEIATNLKLKDIRKSKIPFMPSSIEYLENLVRNIVGDINIEDLKTPFCAVAVDMKTGNEFHMKKGSLVKAIASSCALPTVFNAVEFEDKLLFDGGLLNTIPADVLRANGCDAVISIDINSTRGAGTDSTKYLDLLMASIGIMMKSNVIKGYLNSDLMIKPNLQRFNPMKTEGIQEMIAEGYKATKEQMPRILEIFSKKKKKRRWFWSKNSE